MEFNESRAIYLQIAELICENILSDRWKPGERIPSVREIAAETEVNPNTVMRSYAHLQEKEIIYNKRGIGFFVSDDGKAKTQHMKKEDFLHETLPEFFKQLDLLNIDIDEIVSIYESKFKNFNS